MTTRNLTSNFFQFRTHATRDRNFYATDKLNDDRRALLENEDEDEDVVHFERNALPLWMEFRQRIHLKLDEVRSLLKKLQQLHDKRLTRPDFNENSREEKEIESITKDIISMLNDCRTSFQRFSLQAGKSDQNSYDQQLIGNAMQATATTLQDITVMFRKYQAIYLHKLESRQENSNHLMSDLEFNMNSNPFVEQDNCDDISLTLDGQQQQQLTLQDIGYLEARDKEIQEVLKSIGDIENIFSDVATIVHNQKINLDQIECLLDNTVIQLEQGNEQLIQAVEHQKRCLKFKLIFFGIGFFVLLFIILISLISR